MQNETERLLVIKAALLQTTHTAGWKYIQDIWTNIVKQAIQASLDEDDPTKAESKRLRAKALQQGTKDLFTTIETCMQVGTETQPEWFENLDEFEANRE